MLEPNQLQDLTLLLIQTVPRYVDYSSRHAVVQVLVSLLSAHGTTISNPIVKWLDNETTKHLTKSTASNSRFVLLTWATAAWATTAKSLADAQLFSLGTSIAGLLDSILDQRSSTKPSLRQSALVMTRRAVRTVSRMTRSETYGRQQFSGLCIFVMRDHRAYLDSSDSNTPRYLAWSKPLLTSNQPQPGPT